MRATLLTGLMVSAGCALAGNGVFGGWFLHHEEGTPPPGRPRQFEHSLCRAGHPEVVSGHAAMTDTPEYVGYYVGGGSVHGGDPRACQEGTWGWDYEGLHLRRRVALGWSHGRRFQGGDRAYRNETPHLPDVFIVPRHGPKAGE